MRGLRPTASGLYCLFWFRTLLAHGLQSVIKVEDRDEVAAKSGPQKYEEFVQSDQCGSILL